MRRIITGLMFSLLFALMTNGQTQISASEILSPDSQHIEEAGRQDAQAFKILPRGMFEYEKNELSVRGGGAYYSFVKRSHSYNDIPQIELQKNNLLVGFYGANFGFITDLGETPLSEISRESPAVNFLINYQPPNDERTARNEFYKIGRGFEVDGVKYKRTLPAVVGHTYLLRAISFGEADVLVALKVHRKNADGSLIIFWKLIEDFEKPLLAINQ